MSASLGLVRGLCPTGAHIRLGEILKLPAAEQESMMKNFVALGTKIVEANPAVKKEFETLKTLVDAKAPK